MQPLASESDDDDPFDSGGAGGDLSKVDHIVITPMWKPDSAVLPIFNDVHGEVDKATLYLLRRTFMSTYSVTKSKSASICPCFWACCVTYVLGARRYGIDDACATLEEYINKNALQEAPGKVKLDQVLVDGLFKGFGRKKGAR